MESVHLVPLVEHSSDFLLADPQIPEVVKAEAAPRQLLLPIHSQERLLLIDHIYHIFLLRILSSLRGHLMIEHPQNENDAIIASVVIFCILEFI